MSLHVYLLLVSQHNFMPTDQSRRPSASVLSIQSPRTPRSLCSLIDNSQLARWVPHVFKYAFGSGRWPCILNSSARLPLPCRAKVIETLSLSGCFAHAPAFDLFSSCLRDLVVCGDLFGRGLEASVDGRVEGPAKGFPCTLNDDWISKDRQPGVLAV